MAMSSRHDDHGASAPNSACKGYTEVQYVSIRSWPDATKINTLDITTTTRR